MSIEPVRGGSVSYEDTPSYDPPADSSPPEPAAPNDGVDATPPAPLWTPPEPRTNEPAKELSSDDKSKKEWDAQAAAAAEAHNDAQEAAQADAEAKAREAAATQQQNSNGTTTTESGSGSQKPGGTAGTKPTGQPGGMPTGGTQSAGSNGQGGPAAHPTSPNGGAILTPAQIAEYQGYGLQLRPDGAGGYHIHAPGVETVNIPASPSPTTTPASAPHTPPNSSSPVPQSSSPPAGPAPAGGPAPVETPPAADAEKKITTGLGEKVDEMVNKSPTLKALFEKAANAKPPWNIKIGEPGSKSQADRNAVPPKITISPNDINGGDPSAITRVLAHELGHANHKLADEVPGKGLTRQEYVAKNVDRHLDDEGAANFAAMKARAEIQGNGGPDIGIPGAYPKETQAIYDRYARGEISDTQAAHEMGQLFQNQPHSTGGTYSQVYGAYYENRWNWEHSDVPEGSPAP